MLLFIGIIVTAGLLVPVLYAVETLSLMQNKRVYPLLRLKQQDGRVCSMEVRKERPRKETVGQQGRLIAR